VRDLESTNVRAAAEMARGEFSEVVGSGSLAPAWYELRCPCGEPIGDEIGTERNGLVWHPGCLA
jgi:hypothetical protein